MAVQLADPTQPCRVLGLRERKKQRTRDALVEAAHRLFLVQGYARTTVDEIAAAVDVSQRTFFRYFANKDEVALAVLADAEDHFVDNLRGRPAAENPLQALRNAIVLTWRELGATPEDGPSGITSALELIQLIENTPTLLAAHLRRITEQELIVAGILAEREGLDPAIDLRPRVMAAVFGGVLRSAHLSWSTDGPDARGSDARGSDTRGSDTRGSDTVGSRSSGSEGMIDLIERHFDQLGPALAGAWR